MVVISLELLTKAVISGMVLGGVYSLLAIGLTLITGVMRVMNFAHGDLMMIAMYVTFWLFALFNINPFFSMTLVIPFLFLIGMFIQKFLISPVRTPENQVLITFGLAILLENLALFLWSPDYRSIITPYTTITIHFSHLDVGLIRFLTLIVALVTSFSLHVFVTRTEMGKCIWALAQDPEAAMLVGIDIHKLRLITFGLANALVALAGIFLAQIYYIFPSLGLRFTIIAFIVVILGGFGSVGGALLGSFIIGLTEALGGVFVGIGYKDVMVFIIFILILLFKPSGLFGKIRV